MKKSKLQLIIERIIKEESITINRMGLGTLITFKNDEQWIVVKSGRRPTNSTVREDQVTIKPYNNVAKKNNVNLPIDVSIGYIKKNSTDIVYK